MSTSSGSDKAGPGASDLEAQLQTAWLLRNHVLSRTSEKDMGPLVLAQPAALAAPGIRLLPPPVFSIRCHRYLARVLLEACVPGRLRPATCALFVRCQPLGWSAACALEPGSALFLATCAAVSHCPAAAAAASALVPTLVVRCAVGKCYRQGGRCSPARPECLRCVSLSLCSVLLAALATGSTAAIEAALAQDLSCMAQWLRSRCAPFEPPALDAAEGSAAIVDACCSGSVGVMRRLAQPPYSLGKIHARYNYHWPLDRAVRNGHADVVRELAQPPWCLGEDPDEFFPEAVRSAFKDACGGNKSAVIDVLMRPPYNAAEDRLAVEPAINEACRHSCKSSLVVLLGIVGRWFLPAFLVKACTYGGADVMDLLSKPPFSMVYI
eukprot:m51a1_g14332 hypothetical protein (381) ;mRNA; r:120320-122609